LQVQLKVQQLLWHHNQIHEIFKSSTIASSTQGSTTLVASQPNPRDLSLLQLQVQLEVQQLLGPTTIYTWDVDGGLTSFLYGLFSCQCIHILQVVDKKASL
jgi:hypothetical protein